MTFQLAEKFLIYWHFAFSTTSCLIFLQIWKIIATISRSMRIRSAINYGNRMRQKGRKKVEKRISDKDRKKPIKFGLNLPRFRLRKNDKRKNLPNLQDPSIANIKSLDVIQK